jgi:hypothetical protein
LAHASLCGGAAHDCLPLGAFAFPEQLCEKAAHLDPSFYTFVLTDGAGERTFGHCVRFLPPGVGARWPAVLCALSRHDWHATFRDLLSAMLPWKFFATEASHGHVRWTLCANDICHQNRLLSDFFLAGKTLPIVRGGGQDQAIMQLMRERLRTHGDWLHLFPEGRVRQDGQMNKLKSGLAHLLCGIADADPIVLPFHHRGMENVLRVKTTLPHVGNKIHIIVGQPIEMADLLSRCRKVPPYGFRRTAAGAHARDPCLTQKGEDQRKLAGEIMARVADSLEALRLAQDT